MGSFHVLEYLQNATSKSQSYHSLLTELSCEETLDDDSIKALGDILMKNHQHVHLTTLRLPNNHLTSAAAVPLASILSSTETLRRLEIPHNNLGSEGVTILIQPLIEQKGEECSLVSLNLRDNNLKRKAAAPLADLLLKNKTLQEVDLGHNPIKTQGLKDIVNSLDANKESKLSRLILRATTLGGKGAGMKAILKLLFKNETLHSLDLSSNSLKAVGAVEFSAALVYPNQLHELNLGRNEIGPEGVRAISNALTEDGALQGYCHLKRLTLDWNQLGDEGASILANALENNSTLVYLDLSGNFIGNRGAMDLAKAFTINFCLREILLNDNNIDDEGAFELAQALGRRNSKVETLSWQNNPRMSERGEFLLDHVFQYRESLNTWLGDLEKNIKSDNLMSIDWWTLSDDQVVTDWEVIFLTHSLARHNPKLLQSIFLAGEHITDEGVPSLCENYIGENPPLQRLYMKRIPLSNKGIASLKSALCTNSTLRILSITQCEMAGSIGATNLAVALKHNSTLERINLQGNGIDDNGFQSLWEAILPKNNFPHPSLIALNMGNNKLTDVAMAIMADSGTVALRDLYLDGNQISDRGALDLAKAIMDSTTLKLLTVASNPLMTHKGKNSLRWFAPDRFSC